MKKKLNRSTRLIIRSTRLIYSSEHIHTHEHIKKYIIWYISCYILCCIYIFIFQKNFFKKISPNFITASLNDDVIVTCQKAAPYSKKMTDSSFLTLHFTKFSINFQSVAICRIIGSKWLVYFKII